ncbi:VWA domain-containing protein [Lederbergia sp. NSJ-179]|uniref:VWA domain-containing protein n=1 Tax=Lederbergia sp. NSJ-179 TaxID=2931402 RepID=UPI0037C08C13
MDSAKSTDPPNKKLDIDSNDQVYITDLSESRSEKTINSSDSSDGEYGEFIDELSDYHFYESLDELLTKERNHPCQINTESIYNKKQYQTTSVQSIESSLENNIEQLDDQGIEELKYIFRRLVKNNSSLAFKSQQIVKKRRYKNIDAKRTVRKIAKAGGLFNGFSYKDSPSLSSHRDKPLELLIIGDVSGSMGKYVAITLYIISCLEEVASIVTYIFSDLPTYISALVNKGSFREMYEEMKNQANSWENGTRISLALKNVRMEKAYSKETIVLLITDGGISLVGNDWEDTVKELIELKEEVDRMVLVTPNSELVSDGPECEKKLWDVEHFPRQGNDLLSPELQKIARYGLLTRYHDQIIECKTAQDITSLIEQILTGYRRKESEFILH